MAHVKLDTAAWCTPTQEVTAVRIALDGTERRLLVVSAYCRPYTGKTTTCDFSWVKTLRDAYPTDYTVFGGDLNTHYEAWSSSSTTQRRHDLSSALESTDLAIVNDLNRPTRYAYTDAACHSSGASAVAAVFFRPHPTSLDSPSVYTKTYNSPSSPELAEARAVLLALRTHKTHAFEAPDLAPRDGTLTIYTDFQFVIRALKKQHPTHSPTVSGIFQTALGLYRNYAIRTCNCWIPGHAGVAGNERAHGAAMEEMNKPQLAPSPQSPTSLSLPPSPDSTADETAYDPDEEMRLLKQQWRRRLASS
ncbi:hypothetical protein ISCGN_016242 [Ixodes scapularis]